jgi:hypothetical protein
MLDKKKVKRYASIYGAKSKSIRPDQFLVELIIQRRAEKQGIKLPDRFWTDVSYAYWAKIFYSETKHAKPLFKKYDPECVILAYQSFDCRNILSAANKQLDKVAQEFQRRAELLDATQENNTVVTTNINILPNKPVGKANRLSKLTNE